MEHMGHSMAGLSLDYVKSVANMVDVQNDFNCLGDACDPHFEAFLEHPNWACNGEPQLRPGGSKLGHAIPGVIFLVWGLHTMLGCLRAYFEAECRGTPYSSRSWYRVLWLPRQWPLEPMLKVLLVPLAMASELYFAHSNGYRNLICGPGSVREGHMVGNHLNNWQHASMYPAFFLSGIVDLVGLFVELPEGTGQVFLGLGFTIEAMLMGLHKKHTPLDMVIHELLFYAMAATAAAVMAEVVRPHSFMASAARVGCQLLQAAWFFASARVVFEGRPAWNPSWIGLEDDLAPAMAAPILFVRLAVTVLMGMGAAWVVMYFVYRPDLARTSRAAAKLGGTYESEEAASMADAAQHRRDTCDEEYSLLGTVVSFVTLLAFLTAIPVAIHAARG